jgi:hypothetical protein
VAVPGEGHEGVRDDQEGGGEEIGFEHGGEGKERGIENQECRSRNSEARSRALRCASCFLLLIS